MTKRTYTLSKAQCNTIKEQDRVYVLNATNLLKNTGQQENARWRYPTWVQLTLKRLGDEAIKRWMKANPIPKTVIAVAFDKAERRAA